MFQFSTDALKQLALIDEDPSEKPTASFPDPPNHPAVNTRNAQNTLDTLDSATVEDFVFALFLECRDEPTPGASAAENALSGLIMACQPSPSIAHVELFLADGKGDPHFATYLGRKSGWGFSFGGESTFYTDLNAGLWRAVPVYNKGLAARLRHELKLHVDTPYSLGRYACSVPPLRAFASWLPDRPGDPAHCAALTARCLKRALYSLGNKALIKRASPWYGPTTLLLELSSCSARLGGVEKQEVSEEFGGCVNNLLHASSDVVSGLTTEQKNEAVSHLAKRACCAAQSGDSVAIKIAQKQLAVSLLRSVYS